MPSIYLFLLCPPWTGSTLLWKLIGTSPHVSSFESEGQFLPEVEPIMREKPWDPHHAMPWPAIKEVWLRHWDKTKAYLVEKSPPHILRAQAIAKHFQPVRFVVMVRNPYAHVEGIMRRRGWDARTSAEFSLMCLRHQMHNAQNLPGTLVFQYEDLVGDPEAISRRLEDFLPGLGPINTKAEFTIKSIDGFVKRGVTDLNAKKIEALSPETKSVIREVLATAPETMAYWNYPI